MQTKTLVWCSLDLASRIRDRIGERDQTPAEFCRDIGLSPSHFRKWLQIEQRMSEGLVDRIMDELNLC